MKKVFIFAIFATAILFSMLREWSAPTACARGLLVTPAPPSTAPPR